MPADEKTAAPRHGQHPDSSSLSVGDAVWVSDQEEGFVRCVVREIHGEGTDEAKVVVEVDGSRGPDQHTGPRLHTIALRELCPPHRVYEPLDVDDTTKLISLDTPSILANLRNRYGLDKIYTYVANVLIAVNPYHEMHGLYGDATCGRYRNQPLGSLPPHPFAIADTAYRAMRFDKQSQAIVVSGESGAGKTETAKYLMRYLAFLGGSPASEAAGRPSIDPSGSSKRPSPLPTRLDSHHQQAYRPPKGRSGTPAPMRCVPSVQEKILGANPILESIGNAVTTRNVNSSRFGRLNKLYFDAKGRLVGAGITTYLLESSRVVLHGKGERNYHIFYEMLAGLEESELRKLDLEKDWRRYNLLNQGGTTTTPAAADEQAPPSSSSSRPSHPHPASNAQTRRDRENWANFRRALRSYGITAREEEGIREILAAILILGNLQITQEEDPEDGVCGGDSEGTGEDGGRSSVAESASDANKSGAGREGQGGDARRISVGPANQIQSAAQKLGMDPPCLFDILTRRKIKSGSKGGRSMRQTEVMIERTIIEARAILHSLIKTLYTRLFDYIVDRINDKNKPAGSRSLEEDYRYIGILDIYGFECLGINSFEQLCINLANEKLQQFFVEKVLVNEQRMYKNDGLKWEDIDIQPTCPVIEAITASQGIFALLDDASRLAALNKAEKQNVTDSTFCEQIKEKVHKREMPISGAVEMPRTDRNAAKGAAADRKGRGGGWEDFIVRHYAGKVTYNTQEWLHKNNDRVEKEIEELLDSSERSLVKSFARRLSDADAGKAANQFRSVSKKFRISLDAMIADLNRANLQFIRCFLPNREQCSGHFVGSLVLEQLKHTGTLELVAIMHKGYPSRVSISELEERYRSLLPFGSHWDSRTIIECILLAYGMESSCWQIGVHRVYFKAGQVAMLEAIRQRGPSHLSLPREELLKIRAKLQLKRLRRAARAVQAHNAVLWMMHRLRMRKQRFKKLRAWLKLFVAFVPLFRSVRHARILRAFQAVKRARERQLMSSLLDAWKRRPIPPAPEPPAPAPAPAAAAAADISPSTRVLSCPGTTPIGASDRALFPVVPRPAVFSVRPPAAEARDLDRHMPESIVILDGGLSVVQWRVDMVDDAEASQAPLQALNKAERRERLHEGGSGGRPPCLPMWELDINRLAIAHKKSSSSTGEEAIEGMVEIVTGCQHPDRCTYLAFIDVSGTLALLHGVAAPSAGDRVELGGIKRPDIIPADEYLPPDLWKDDMIPLSMCWVPRRLQLGILWLVLRPNHDSSQQQQQQPGSGVEVSGCRAMLRLTIFNEEDMLFKSVDGGRRTLMSRDIEMPDPLPALEKYCGTMEEARAIMEETVFTSYRLTALASGKGFVIAGPGMLTALRVCEDPYVFGASTEPVTLRTLEIHWQGHKESPVTTSKGDIDIRQQFFTSCATLYHPTEQERSQLAIPPASRLPHPKPTSKHTRDSRETNTNTVLRQQHHPGTSIPRHPKASGWRPPREPSGERVGSRLVSGRECEVRERKEGWRKEAKVFEEGVEQLLLGEGRSNLYSFSFQYMPAPHSPLNPKRTPGTTGTTRGRPPSPSPPPASRVLPRKKLQLLSVDSMPDWHKTFMQAPDDEEQTRFHLVKVRGVGPAADPLAPSTEPLSLPAHICSISHRADIVSLPPFSFKALPPPPPAPPAPPAAAAAAAAAGASSSSNGNSSSSRGEGGRWRRRLSMSTVVPQSMETIDSCYWPVYPSERKEFLFHEDVNVLAAEPCHAAHSMVLWAAGGRGLVYHVPSRCVVCTFIKPDHTGSTEGRRS